MHQGVYKQLSILSPKTVNKNSWTFFQTFLYSQSSIALGFKLFPVVVRAVYVIWVYLVFLIKLKLCAPFFLVNKSCNKFPLWLRSLATVICQLRLVAKPFMIRCLFVSLSYSNRNKRKKNSPVMYHYIKEQQKSLE